MDKPLSVQGMRHREAVMSAPAHGNTNGKIRLIDGYGRTPVTHRRAIERQQSRRKIFLILNNLPPLQFLLLHLLPIKPSKQREFCLECN